LCRPDYTIIDGFRRPTVAGDGPLDTMLKGKVPAVTVRHVRQAVQKKYFLEKCRKRLFKRLLNGYGEDGNGAGKHKRRREIDAVLKRKPA
jgi:hypothetical protein